MITKLAHVSILVPDLDEALDWYTNVLGLEKREDNSSVVAGFRWLTVAPKGQADPEIVLFLPGPFQAEEDRKILLSRVGQGTMWMLHTDDCAKEHERLSGLGVKFHQTPEDRALGSPGRLRRSLWKPVRYPGARRPLID